MLVRLRNLSTALRADCGFYILSLVLLSPMLVAFCLLLWVATLPLMELMAQTVVPPKYPGSENISGWESSGQFITEHNVYCTSDPIVTVIAYYEKHEIRFDSQEDRNGN